MACMKDGLSRFIQDLVRFFSGLQTNLGEHLKKRNNELTSLSNEISSLIGSQNSSDSGTGDYVIQLGTK